MGGWFSSVAGGAVLRGVDFPVVCELRSFISGKILRSNPVQVVDLLWGAKIGGRIALAIQTEAHAQRFGMINFVHLVNLAVAMDAGNTPVHVNGVVKINVIRRLVDLDPRHWGATGETLTHGSQARVVGQHLIMTVHAGVGRRDVREPRLLNTVVAIPAINPQLVSMNRVGERHGLYRLIPDPGVLGGEIVSDSSRGHRANQHYPHQYPEGQLVCPLRKDV